MSDEDVDEVVVDEDVDEDVVEEDVDEVDIVVVW